MNLYVLTAANGNADYACDDCLTGACADLRRNTPAITVVKITPHPGSGLECHWCGAEPT